MPRKFRIATAAGTFDHFHKGHKHFLLRTFEIADTIYIAITSDTFALSSRQLGEITPFAARKKTVQVFLRKENLLKRAKFIELHDIYGPTLEPDCPIEAVIVTQKTLYGAELINKLRGQKGLPPLDIIETPIVKAADGGEISSSRIRAGEIDRRGNSFIKKEWLEKDLSLPDELRPSLQKPTGELIEGSEKDLSKAVDVIKQQIHPRGGLRRLAHFGGGKNLIVTVGDVVAKSFNEGGLAMDIAIVDYHVKRVETFKNLSEIGFSKMEPDTIAENPKGTLTGELFQAVKQAFSNLTMKQSSNVPYIIRVIGEEDLATLAVILAAPLGSRVYYGQPDEGIVEVVVTEEKKAEVYNIVSQFES